MTKPEDFSTQPVGEELAAKVADKVMEEGERLGQTHRDYCGLHFGSIKEYYGSESKPYDHSKDKGIIIGHSNDGWPPGGSTALKTFTNKDEFVAWLAVQSDLTLSGFVETQYLPTEKHDWAKGNQRPSVASMKAFVGMQ